MKGVILDSLESCLPDADFLLIGNTKSPPFRMDMHISQAIEPVTWTMRNHASTHLVWS